MYKTGERVKIVRGKYKEHGTATFLGRAGEFMCRVAVDGDIRAERTIWISSIAHFEQDESKGKDNDYYYTVEHNITKKEMQQLIREMKLLRLQVKKAEELLKNYMK